MIPWDRLRLVVFDLDGTLLSSLGTIGASVNQVRELYGASQLSAEEVQRGIGGGARRLLELTCGDLLKAWEEKEALPRSQGIDRLYEAFLTMYIQKSHTTSELYPEARELLLDLQRSYALAILTNKPEAATEVVVEALGLRSLFAAVVSPETYDVKKPDPRGLDELREDLNCSREETLFVGDSNTDFETGRRGGVLTVGLRSGYGPCDQDDAVIWFENVAALRQHLSEYQRMNP